MALSAFSPLLKSISGLTGLNPYSGEVHPDLQNKKPQIAPLTHNIPFNNLSRVAQELNDPADKKILRAIISGRGNKQRVFLLSETDRKAITFRKNRQMNCLTATIFQQTFEDIAAIITTRHDVLSVENGTALLLGERQDKIPWLEKVITAIKASSQMPETSQEINKEEKIEEVPAAQATQTEQSKSEPNHKLFHKIVVDLDEQALTEYLHKNLERLKQTIPRLSKAPMLPQDAEDAIQNGLCRIFELQQTARRKKSLPFQRLVSALDKNDHPPIYSTNKRKLLEEWEQEKTTFCRTPEFFSTWLHKILINSTYNVRPRNSDAMYKSDIYASDRPSDDTLSDNWQTADSGLYAGPKSLILENPLDFFEHCADLEREETFLHILEEHQPVNPAQQAKLEVLRMHVLARMEYQDIANTLDIPIGTVRSRINRAKNLLLELYEAQQASHKSIPHLMTEPR
ncbi:MAG: sigma factor-like helix-turn-helix DNA-binding protein [Pseudobdellovibrionaceae bacterium]|jgi:DNA-directed RNA polymerase specialized sigma24 family protein|nr:sigma factor-like helix-turn-helix DNA-binding protein [Pseudobdellovibrionaceae bacterium]